MGRLRPRILYHVTTGAPAGLGKMSESEQDLWSFTTDLSIAKHIANILKVYAFIAKGQWNYDKLREWFAKYFGRKWVWYLDKAFDELKLSYGDAVYTEPKYIAEAFNRAQLFLMLHDHPKPYVWVVSRENFASVDPRRIVILIAKPKEGARPVTRKEERLIRRPPYKPYYRWIEVPVGEEQLKEVRYREGDFLWIGAYLPPGKYVRFPPTEDFATALREALS